MQIRHSLFVILGAATLPTLSLAGSNTQVGDYALYSVTTGVQNSAFGNYAGTEITGTSNNTVMGFQAMVAGRGAGNTAIGANAANFNYGYGNTALGIYSLGGGDGSVSSIWEFTGGYNTAVGAYASAAPYTVNSGEYVTAIGAFALYKNGASYNTAVGSQALYSNANGANNTALGYGSMAQNVSGSNNTAVGHLSLVLSVGSDNTAVGYQALYYNQADGITAVGSQALYSNTTGSYNTAVGEYALNATTTGSDNVAIGAETLRYNVTGSDNLAIGRSALRNSTSGGFNSLMGYASCWTCRSASQNVGMGFKTLYSLSSGNYNIALGYAAGYNLTGSNNIDLANNGMSTDSGVIRIGASTTQTKAYIAGIFGSKVTGAPVYVTSDGQLGTMASAQRYKTGVTSLADPAAQLARLRPVSFHLKSDPEGPLQYGLIAEELAKVYPELVIRDDHGVVQGVRYDELTPILLKQTQALQHTVAAQAVELAALRTESNEFRQLKARLLRLERTMATATVAAR